MKAKNIYIMLLCAMLACPLFASASNTRMQMQPRMQQNTQEWTQAPGIQTADRGGMAGGQTPSQNPEVSGPVGDTAWAIILGMGLTYGAYIFSKKRKEAQE